MFIDTHAHLFYSNFENDLDDVINRAREAGVDYIIVPGTDIQTSKQAIALAEKYDFIYCTVGIHPHETKDWDSSSLSVIEELAHHKKVVAVGEIGLDYYYDFSPKEKQIEAFKAQIDLALKLGLPVVIHNREADKDMMDIVNSYCGTGLKAQFHCFNNSIEDAIELIKMNHFISYTGNITFKKADALRDTLSKTHLQHLLLETDSPFMTPVPFRGKRNEPAYVKYVAEQAAESHKISVEEVARITSYNVFRLFGVGSRPGTSFTYRIKDNLYVNITNRCNADCVFCDRKGEASLFGFNLKMAKKDEPDSDFYIKEIGDPTKFKEIVFCGYGEPTLRWDIVKKIAFYVKSKGGRTRLDTNGHGSFVNRRDITPEMKGLIDSVSISLNAGDSDKYAEILRVDKTMFNETIIFAKNAKNYVERLIISVVSYDDIQIEKARKIAEENIGAEFRVREYF
jgi:TatD DNase family protein